MVRQTPGHPVVSISERLRLPSGHHAYGSAARPLRPQIKGGVILEYYHLLIIWLFEARTCVFAMLKTVRLEGGLYECPLKLKLLD